MARMRRLLLGLSLALLAAAALAFAPPDFQGDVLDEVGVLSAADRALLAERIRTLREQDGIWAAVYVTAGLQEASIEEAAVDTFQHWKLGQKGKDNGLLVLVAPNQRKMRIEVGYGLEGTITDVLSKHVIDDIYRPAFRERHFAAGLMAGFDRLAQAMHPGAADSAPASVAEPSAAAADNTLVVDWSDFGLRFFGVWLVNLCLPLIYWAVLRRRIAQGRLPRQRAADGVRNAFVVFAFLGGVFGLFAAVFGAAFADEDGLLPGLFAANGLFDLVFFVPMLFSAGRARSAGDADPWSDGRSRWRAGDSSSSWDSGSDSSSSSSSDGGSSGGGGASGDY